MRLFFLFQNNTTDFLLDILPFTSLKDFIYESRFQNECEYTSFKGIPKTLERLVLCGFDGINFNKYKNQLSSVILIDLWSNCGYCGGIYNLEKKFIDSESQFLFKCKDVECKEENENIDPINYDGFYIKNFKLYENDYQDNN